MQILIAIALFAACDDTRVYDKNEDFEDGLWSVNTQPVFEFEIQDSVQRYDVLGNVRNSISYPFSRVFLTFYLQDSVGKVLDKKLVSHMLFDPKTGEPQGNSGLGDIYDHRVPMLMDYKFPYSGKFKFKLEQSMRTDSLAGVLAVGLRIEKKL
jgi:gliding motility-associated lipoprotein GldH